MDNQDFEAYARAKPFNMYIADTWQAALDEAFERLGRPLDTVRLLDYGCGDGKYFGYFKSRGLAAENIHGVEVSQLRVQRCHAIGWKNAVAITPRAPLHYGSGQFDLINCMEVIEHVPAQDASQLLAELRRVLRPGGLLMISTPNYPIKRFYDISDAVLHRKWARLRDDPTHVTRFNHVKLITLLQPHFAQIMARPFKPGFLYARIPRPFFLHKLFFLCQA